MIEKISHMTTHSSRQEGEVSVTEVTVGFCTLFQNLEEGTEERVSGRDRER